MAKLMIGNPYLICVHHSAVSPGARNIGELQIRAKSYNSSHSTKPWANEIKTPGEYGYQYIEYHFMIAKDGSLLQVQDQKYILYHAGDSARGASSFNLHGTAVLLDGNYQTEVPTEAQKQTLAKFIVDFEKKYKVNVVVRGHKETSLTGTACPGNNIGTSKIGWLKSVIELANEMLKPQPPKFWWEECVDLGKQEKVANKDTALYDIDKGSAIMKYPKGSKAVIRYQYQDWYLTEYSYDKHLKNGFKVADWDSPTVPCEEQLKALKVENEALKQINQDLNAELEEAKKDLAEIHSISSPVNNV